MTDKQQETDLERVTRQRDELVAALQELLWAAGPCDDCYEDNCDQFYCECKCHEAKDNARKRAAQAIAGVGGDKSCLVDPEGPAEYSEGLDHSWTDSPHEGYGGMGGDA